MLNNQKSSSKDLYLSPEIQAEEKKFRKDLTDANKEIREVNKDLKRDKDKLSAKIIFLNMAVVPGLVLLAGIVVALSRHRSSRAR